jgi:hypothetical protein
MLARLKVEQIELEFDNFKNVSILRDFSIQYLLLRNLKLLIPTKFGGFYYVKGDKNYCMFNVLAANYQNQLGIWLQMSCKASRN